MHYLLRHGQTNYNRAGLVQGHSNEATLLPEGEEEMRRSAAILNREVDGFEEVVCSDLVRARQSWELLKELINWAHIRFSAVWREQYQGHFQGRSYTDPEWVKYQEKLSQGGVPFQDLETPLQFRKRVWTALRQGDPSRKVLYLTHGGVISLVAPGQVKNGGIVRLVWPEGITGEPLVRHLKNNVE